MSYFQITLYGINKIQNIFITETPTIEELQFNTNNAISVRETLTGANPFKVYKLLMGTKKQVSSLQLNIENGTETLYYVVQKDTETLKLENDQIAQRNFIESHLSSSDISGDILYNNDIVRELRGGTISPGMYYIFIFYILDSTSITFSLGGGEEIEPQPEPQPEPEPEHHEL